MVLDRLCVCRARQEHAAAFLINEATVPLISQPLAVSTIHRLSRAAKHRSEPETAHVNSRIELTQLAPRARAQKCARKEYSQRLWTVNAEAQGRTEDANSNLIRVAKGQWLG